MFKRIWLSMFAFLLSGWLFLGSFSLAADGGGFENQNTNYNPNVAGDTWNVQDAGLLDVVKNMINWALGILGLIALIMLLWWGFQMVTAAGNEEKYKKWFTILKQAGIWLVLIWLSWFIVSIIMRLVTSNVT